MEIRLNRASCVRMVQTQGWQTFLEALDSHTGHRLSLYSVSQDWLTDASYICKAKGGRGDLLVSWS